MPGVKVKHQGLREGTEGHHFHRGVGVEPKGGRAASLEGSKEVSFLLGVHSLEQRPGARPALQESPRRWSNQTSLRGQVAKGSLGHYSPMVVQL